MIPSSKSSSYVLAAARQALDKHGRFWLGNVTKVESEFYELGILTEEERYASIDIALMEIGPKDRMGPRSPNDISVHPPFTGAPLYAFCWASAHFAKRMYIKFALISGSGPSQLVIY